MIFLSTGNQKLLILEPANIEKIKAGQPLVAPDKSVLIAYSPDAVWAGEQIMKAMQGRRMDVEVLDQILKDGLARPEVMRGDDDLKKVL